MRPRLRLRLRTVLIAIALLGPPLAGVAAIGRQGGLAAFRRHHRDLADGYSDLAVLYGFEVDKLLEHAAAGHSCQECQQRGRPPDELIAKARRNKRDHEFMSRWHRFLSFGLGENRVRVQL